jgi:hypothetical protein
VASGLFVMQDGSVMVAYGTRHIAISCAQYKANGYKPPLEKLVTESPSMRISSRGPPRRKKRLLGYLGASRRIIKWRSSSARPRQEAEDFNLTSASSPGALDLQPAGRFDLAKPILAWDAEPARTFKG